MKTRSYGLDLFRFFGAFIVLAGHLTLLLAYTPITENVWGYFSSPLFWVGIIMVPVPVFMVISGYFGLARPNRENEVQRTLKSVLNLLIIFVAWVLIMVVYNTIINGGAFTLNFFNDFVFALFNTATYTITAMGPLAAQGLFVSQTAPLWYLWTFAGFTLLAPLFRAFFSNANIKVVRLVMIAIFVGTFVWPNINNLIVGSNLAETHWIRQIFGASTFFAMDQVGYSLLFYYLLGGWMKLEKGYHTFVSKVPYWAIVVVLLASLIPASQVMYTSYTGGLSLGYESLLLLPGIISLFVLFNKLDSVVTEDTRVGKFVKKHGGKTLGIYVSHVFIIAVFTNIVGFANVNEFMTGFDNALGILIHFLYAVVIFVLSFGLVSLLKRIPIIKKIV